MAQIHDEPENKTDADVVSGGEDVGEVFIGETKNGRSEPEYAEKEEDKDLKSLYSLILLTMSSILFPDPKTSDSFIERMKNSVDKNGQKMREASVRTGRQILLWTRKGSSLRSLLVITMGTIVLLTTMALVVFTLVLIAATANAIIISLLISLAIAGSFLAFFLLCLTGVYIGALSFAAFVISTATISGIVSVLIASGWIGFFYVVWLGTRGSLRLAKQSVSMVGSAISGNGFSRHQHQDREVNIESSN